MSVDIAKLVTTSPLENSLSAFLVEPREAVPFAKALRWQREWQHNMLDDSSVLQAVWLLQHPKCYTLGKGSSESNLLFDPLNPPAPLYRIGRGGEVTHHLPGQLVAYPVLDLRNYQADLHWYLRELEEVLLDVLLELGLIGERIAGLTGIWIQRRKVGAIGVGCRRWITQHGLALNIDCDLDGFNSVIPCGLHGHQVGALNHWIPGLKVSEVQPLIRMALSKHFRLSWEFQDPIENPE